MQVERRFQFDDIPLHERLKLCRQRRELTQKVAAERIGRSERWMVDVEAGRVDLRISDIGDLADVYSVAPELLTADQFDIDASRVPSEARSGRISSRARTAAPQGTLIMESDDAELRYQDGVYHAHMRRHLFNAGEAPVTRFDVRINVDRHPGDPERSSQMLRVAGQAAGVHVFSKGIGLAAPQIGVARAAAIVRLPEAAPLVLLNPRMVEESDESDEQYEGCLSFFDVRGLVPRPMSLVVEYTDLDAVRDVARFERGAARLIYHEIDHLHGMLYTDRMAPGQTPIPISRYHGTGAPWDY